MKVAVTGATGFVGSRLVERLQQEGHQVLVLTRSPEHARRQFSSAAAAVEIVGYEPLQSGPWQSQIAGCEGVVNLAGAPIAESRWTPERKQEILDSRKVGTQKIVEAIGQANPRPVVLVNSSAIGYYGTSETASFDETSPAGSDFLAQVCLDWEAAAEQVKQFGTRLVILRTGIVVGSGGAIAKMLPPFQLFAGGPLGSGKQWFSWIHIDDLVNLIISALTQPNLEGVFNATAPQPVKMAELSQTLGEILNRPSWLPVPAFALEALLGDAAKVVLEGQQVLPKRAEAAGFTYQYRGIRQALQENLKR